MFLINDHQPTKLSNGYWSLPPNFPEMDPDIWSRLPEELLDQILCFLPLKSFFNLRSTSKHFHSLIFSPSFISNHSSSSSSFSSFLLLSHPQCYQRFPLYDSVSGTWRNLELPSSSSSSSSSSSLLSTSNGLSCFSLPNSSSFLVCNFLANSSRIVHFPTYPFAFELLTLVSCSKGYYKIFMVSSESTLVYDSSVHSWSQSKLLQPILSDNHHQQGVVFNGCLYFTTPEPFSVVFFELETGEWRRSITQLPGELTFARLVSDGAGKLYMVGGIGGNGISRSMKLWEMSGTGDWEETGDLPAMMCRKFWSVSYHNYDHVYCLWHQGMICVCCYTWPEILYYKVSRRTWHWLPKSPLLPRHWSCGFRWFSFVPQLYATV